MTYATTISHPLPRLTRYLGYGLSLAVAAVLLLDGLTGLLRPEVLAAPMQETGFPAGMLWVVGSAAVSAAVLYMIPRTAFIGAILATAFAGGAIATHVRVGDLLSPPQLICVAIAAAAWGGLWLRDRRVRALLPIG